MKFAFQTNGHSHKYCENIVLAISALYGTSQSESLEKINTVWHGQDFLDDDDVRYHETYDYWANTVMS